MDVNSLDEALSKPSQITGLNLSRETDSDKLIRVGELANLENLSVSLSDARPLLSIVQNLPNLRHLSFQACKLEAFPEEVLELTKLETLRLGNNQIRSIPMGIGGLTNLRFLYLSQNEIKTLPAEIYQLVHLDNLGLSYNRLSEVSQAIGSLGSLTRLFLDCNRLTTVPDSIGDLENLEYLALRHNKLGSIPKSIASLKNLKSLTLENNEFAELPSELEALSKRLDHFGIESRHRNLFMDWTYRPNRDLKPIMEVESLDLNYSQFDQATSPLYPTLLEFGLERYSAELHRDCRKAIEIDTTEPAGEEVGLSRLGGFPDLASPDLFPVDETGLYWVFLAQLRFSDICEMQNYLPRTGLLSFFIDSTEDIEAKVIYYEGDLSKLRKVVIDPSKLTDDCDDYTATPFKVEFSNAVSMPSTYMPPEYLSSEHESAYEAFIDSMSADEGHAINGYTFTQHESPEQQAADEKGGAAEEWIPLLKLGYDSDVGFCFWDAGTITFVIHREDLVRHDFSRVRAYLESS